MKLRLHTSAYVLALATTALHLAVCHRFGYYRDELYFIDCAKHLAWGYVDQPPLAPFVTWLTAPLGYPVWGLRFLPAILSGVTVLYGCAIARELRGGALCASVDGVDDRPGPGIDRHCLRPFHGASFAGGVDGFDLFNDSAGQDARHPALPPDRAGRDARDVCEIFDRCVCLCFGARIAADRPRQSAAVALASCSAYC